MKRKVLFVGSFKDKAKDGSVGGQMYASKSLITSDLSQEIDWILLDTTGESVPPPPVYVRIFFATKRTLTFLFLILFKRPDSVLIFSANSPSIYEKGFMAICASFLKIKVIIAPRGGPLNREIEQSRFLKKFVTFLFSRSTYIVCQGRYWKDFFSVLLPQDQSSKFVIIPNWIDIDQYNHTNIEKSARTGINILYMGWIQEDKGVNDIFKALSIMEKIDREVNFYFLGDGPDRPDLQKQVNSGKYPFNIFFPGWVHGEEKSSYLANSDIFILASHSEGLPNSLMEAMVSEIASISTNVGSVADLIINDETGILVKKKDVRNLALGLTTLILDDKLRNRISLEGRKHIVQNHSIIDAVNKFKQIL
jgi:glycosyltransferase involved in cell wall biosynthesis